jgi:hypothetical protein
MYCLLLFRGRKAKRVYIENCSYNDLFRPYLETITGPWSSLYHVHEEPIDLFKVTKKTIKLTNHIVVTGSLTGYYKFMCLSHNGKGLADFILPLRSRKIRAIVPIVILNPVLPDVDIWENIGVFPEIYFVHVLKCVIKDIELFIGQRTS